MIQVFDADAEMAAIVRRGGRIARDPISLAGVAGLVADPDGNWIEISARTSLTDTGLHHAMLLTHIHTRLLQPGLAQLIDPDPPLVVCL